MEKNCNNIYFFTSLVSSQLKGRYFSTFLSFEIIDLTRIECFFNMSETLMWGLRILTTFVQIIIFNGESYYHCSSNCFQLLIYKHWNYCIGNCESQHWTCLVCSDRSTIYSTKMHCWNSSVSLGIRDLSLIGIY